jgi:hypothetical protein
VLGSLLLAGPACQSTQPPAPPAASPTNADLGRQPVYRAEVDFSREPVLPPGLNLGALGPAPASPANPHRIRLLGIQPGFLSDPIGLNQDADTPADSKSCEPDPDWITVTLGNDNPYFDFRQRGDPGGVGFTRLNTQVQLFDSRSTACSLGMQAVTPSGLQFDGLPDWQGPTVVSPALSLFQAVDDDTVLQGFVGKHVPLANSCTQPLRQGLQYGMALQRPVAVDGADGLRDLYLYVGALGQYRAERESAQPPVTWEVLPGLHWRMADNCWLTGGVMLPVGPARSDVSGGRWQLTCSFQF